MRRSHLHEQAQASVTADRPLGDLSAFRTITADISNRAQSGDMTGARAKADDLETAWDNAQGYMQSMNPDKWTLMDGKIDDVLKKVRASSPNASAN